MYCAVIPEERETGIKKISMKRDLETYQTMASQGHKADPQIPWSFIKYTEGVFNLQSSEFREYKNIA